MMPYNLITTLLHVTTPYYFSCFFAAIIIDNFSLVLLKITDEFNPLFFIFSFDFIL